MIVTKCLACAHPLSTNPATLNVAESRCDVCGARQIQLIYPANFLRAEIAHAGKAADGTASCFHHDTSAATEVCDGCGRYLCALCMLEIPLPATSPPDFPKRLCAGCFEHRVNEETTQSAWDLFRTRYTRYDILIGGLVLGVVFLPPLLVLSPFAWPIALILIVRYWRFARTPVGDYGTYLVLFFILSSLGTFFWLTALISGMLQVLR